MGERIILAARFLRRQDAEYAEAQVRSECGVRDLTLMVRHLPEHDAPIKKTPARSQTVKWFTLLGLIVGACIGGFLALVKLNVWFMNPNELWPGALVYFVASVSIFTLGGALLGLIVKTLWKKNGLDKLVEDENRESAMLLVATSLRNKKALMELLYMCHSCRVDEEQADWKPELWECWDEPHDGRMLK